MSFIIITSNGPGAGKSTLLKRFHGVGKIHEWMLSDLLDPEFKTARGVIVVTDVTKVTEVKLLRKKFPDMLHFHMFYTGADNPSNNDTLYDIADYILESPSRV